MNDLEKVFLFVSPELQKLLDDNNVDLIDLLKNDGISVERSYELDPSLRDGFRSKEPVTVLLATAAVILALTPTLSKIIERSFSKRLITEEIVLLPVEDSKGKVVFDQAGNPVMYWTERDRILSPSSEKSNTKFSVSGLGIKLSFSESIQS